MDLHRDECQQFNNQNVKVYTESRTREIEGVLYFTSRMLLWDEQRVETPETRLDKGRCWHLSKAEIKRFSMAMFL